ncbi:YeiH family protein [Campylobacter upsaliensis]|nr:YeiH family protein [Campylobacter upsaliensis]MCR2107335.1 YeiH family protein [Campylobacter upsaliensis]MCR2114523.1 YeiH family protein [Campylobacter upsaliensis]MCR2119617.1 YeiH family protein [Campylobacter upsaliensis]MCR2121816.1 YeiH family protein [Campylobacter upsaliensis]MCR2123986.1 YeiH family protein [Campylobacter upsaliensis]
MRHLYLELLRKVEKAVVFSAKKLLRLGIILFGFNVTLGSIASVA